MGQVRVAPLKDGWGVEVTLLSGRRGMRPFYHKQEAEKEAELLRNAKSILRGEDPIEHLVHVERYGED